MADLAVTAHQQPQVAVPARSNSSGNKSEAAFSFSLEQLLQGGVMPRHPPAADLLRAEREPLDRGNPADEESVGSSRKRFQTGRLETIDRSRDAEVAPPVQHQTDHAPRRSADTDDAEHPDERADRRDARLPMDPADAAAATQSPDTGMPVNAVPQSPRHAAQGSAAPAPGGSEGPVQPVAEIAARPDAKGQPGGSQAASGTGTGDPGATAAGAQAAQGQNSATTAATGAAVSPFDKTLSAPSAATASDGRGPAGIAAGAAPGGAETAQQSTRAAAAPARTEPFQQQRIVSDQVSVHIKKAVQEGTDRIEIRLKPESLGRVDVRLELGPEGRVVATIIADQRHTLELLRSDARSLERALQEAGLQTDGGSLNFNLRSDDDGRPGQHEGQPADASLPAEPGTDGGAGQTASPPGFSRAAARPGGIDIHA